MRTIALAVALAVLPTIAAAQSAAFDDSAELRRFESCSEVERYLEDLAIENLRRSAARMREWSWRRRPYGFPGLQKEAPSAAPSAAARAEADSSGPSAYTQTNVQVGGVDEADFVKTDGKRLYVLAQGALHVLKSWPVEDLEHQARVAIEGQPTAMFLGEDGRVIVFSQVPYASAAPARAAKRVVAYARAGTKVTVVDTSRADEPRIAGQTWLSGQYQSARRIGSAVRVVLNDHLPYLHGYPHRVWDGDEESVDGWVEQGVRAIRRMTLDELLPSGERLNDGDRIALPTSCDDVFRPRGAVRPGSVSVVTLDLDDVRRFHRTVLLTQAGQVYASHEALYVASPQWWWNGVPNRAERTFVHKLDISDPDRSYYVASGAIEGHLLNQFSMDEHEGHLRVATTQTRTGASRGGATINKVRVLAARGDRLRVIGETEDLAPGERIYSARFLGDMGYVVTFRQVDPLFTLDLSNPRAPRKVGELKVPGFSTYIHPIDDGYLLTVGVHVPEGSNRRAGMKISVFDVRDPADPKEAFTRVVDNNAWSESLHDHKAFNYFARKRLLAIPVYHHANGSYVSELAVFRIHPKSGVREKGTLSVSDVRLGPAAYAAPIRRSVMADEFVYAISEAGVRVAELGALDEPIATALFAPAPAVSAR